MAEFAGSNPAPLRSRTFSLAGGTQDVFRNPFQRDQETEEKSPTQTGPSSGFSDETIYGVRRGTYATVGTARTYISQQELLAHVGRRPTFAGELDDVRALLQEIFDQERPENLHLQQTRHVGIVWKNVSVTGHAAGTNLQPTVFSPLHRVISALRSLGRRGEPRRLRTLINDFTGCIHPGEMLLVLGRPGAGASTFLKAIANQTSGFVDVAGSITYGGLSNSIMEKRYRDEIIYIPEDDLHYAAIDVRETLSFALALRVPPQALRRIAETRQDYIRTFIRMISRLFWIEHTLATRVGNEYIRGVSGGEKKRVSIAEAMISKASNQCWDNATRGLDANSATEYVKGLRALTNMAVSLAFLFIPTCS